MLRLSIWIGLLTLYGTILAQDIVPYNELHVLQESAHSSRTKRFGFSIVEKIRQNFCNSSLCRPSDDSSSFMLNFICAIKCPELYLPQNDTVTRPITPPVVPPPAVPMPPPAVPPPAVPPPAVPPPAVPPPAVPPPAVLPSGGSG